MTQHKLPPLPLDAIRRLQELAKAQGFRSMPDEKVFMDELSGEDDGIQMRPPASDNDLP